MANYSTLKAAVADVVKTNGTQAITGANLQAVLLSIINSVGGGGYIFKGVATPSTSAGTPDENVFYLGGAGTYANFGASVTVPVGSICVFKYNGSWTNEQIETSYGGVFDISEYHATGGTLATYADLAAALGNGGANVPSEIRKGGMCISFVQSSDNKYVQYRLMNQSWSSTVSDWQGVDWEPTAGSKNLVNSGGVIEYTKEELSDLNNAVFGILVNTELGFKNTWDTPTQFFVAPSAGKYTVTLVSDDYAVLSPSSVEYLMVDNTVVPLGSLTAETISQLSTGYTISNIELAQGGILELRDRLSGNVNVVVKNEDTGLIYEVNKLNDKEELSDLNNAVFGILVNTELGFKNTWDTPTQFFVAPSAGKYTVTLVSDDYAVLSPSSAEYLMVDNTVVPLGTLTAETISQLSAGYTISNIELAQGGILELRDRLSGNVSVVIKNEDTGLIYEVNKLNDKDVQPLPGSKSIVESGGVFLENVKLRDSVIENRNGIAFDTQICELPNNANFNCQLIHPLESHGIYSIRLSTDRPLSRLAIVEPTGGSYILDISNVGILKDYEITYYDAKINSVFHMFQTNSDGKKCNLSFSIGKVEQSSIESNKQDITRTKKGIVRLKDSIQVKESSILSNNNFLFSVGDHVLVNATFKKDSTYLIKIQCDDSIECTELTLYNGHVQDRVTVSGKLNGKEIIYTPFMDGNILRYYLIGTITNNFIGSVEVIELQNFVTDKWELIQHRTFESTSTSNLQDIRLLWPTPFITKGNRYKVIIYFANTPFSFTQAFLNVSSNPRVTEVTTQFEIPAKSNTSYVEIEFTAPYDSFRIWSTFSFSGVLSNPPVGDAYLFKVGTTEYSALEENDIKNTSRFTGFLISYSSDNATPHSGTKLMLGYSTDGFHFRKLKEPFVHDFYEEYGYELYNDLCIFKKGEYFYLTGSSTRVPEGATNVPVHIVKSKNLKDWEHHATLQFPVSSFPVDAGNRVMAIWAPEILELNGSYYLSFAVGEAENPYVEKGYLVDLNSGLTSYSNLRPYTINMDYFAYTFDNTFLYDAEKGKYYGYFLDGSIYETDSLNDSNEGEWQAIGMLPLQENGYSYMEGGTIIKYKGWYYIYGDATLVQGVETPVTQNLACFRTKDFKKYEVCFEQFDIKLRHPKIILIDSIDSAIAKQLYIDSLI